MRLAGCRRQKPRACAIRGKSYSEAAPEAAAWRICGGRTTALLVPGRRLILRLAGVKGLDGWRTEHKSSEDRVYPLSGLKRDKRAEAVRDRSNDSNNTCTAPALGRWRLRLCANAHELGPNRRPAHRPDSAGSRQDDVPRRDGAGRACHQCKRSSGHSIARPRKSFA